MSTTSPNVLALPTGTAIPVKVVFHAMDFAASLAKIALDPDGNHWIKLTAISTNPDKYKIEFCDATGATSGFNAGNPSAGDYGDFSAIVDTVNPVATKHYWKNRMPMALAFPNVTFTFDETAGTITNGNGVTAMARANGNPNGVLPAPNFPPQDSNSSAAIITTTGNTTSAFKIRVKLGFQLNFEVEMTKI